MKAIKWIAVLAAFLAMQACSKKENAAVPQLATVTTGAAENIINSSATIGGNISSDGGAAVTERGVCFSINANPLITGDKVQGGQGTGAFTATPTGLSFYTTYYARAYAVNTVGVSYGNEVSFVTLPLFSTSDPVSDREGNVYQTQRIGSQVWMKQNLNTAFFKNGDSIPEVQNPLLWSSLSTPAWCYYEGSSANGAVYGKLYNWYAVNDPRGLAPVGWHIPIDSEWTTLYNRCEGELFAGAYLKEEGTSHWASPNLASNASGFTALPAGCLTIFSPYFFNKGTKAFWWSATEGSADFANFRWLANGTRSGYINTSIGSTVGGLKGREGLSVRCVKN